MTDVLEPGETYAPTWTVGCQHPRCGWSATSIQTSDLELQWEEHDEAEHDA